LPGQHAMIATMSRVPAVVFLLLLCVMAGLGAAGFAQQQSRIAALEDRIFLLRDEAYAARARADLLAVEMGTFAPPPATDCVMLRWVWDSDAQSLSRRLKRMENEGHTIASRMFTDALTSVQQRLKTRCGDSERFALEE